MIALLLVLGCDLGLFDSADPPCDPRLVFWVDADGDGWGADSTAVLDCEASAGVVDRAGDCDDADGAVNPDAAEVWYDGLDQDCAGDDDCDQDADGVPAPDDCDDTDPNDTGTCPTGGTGTTPGSC